MDVESNLANKYFNKYVRDNDSYPENNLKDLKENDAFTENHGEDDFIYGNNDDINNQEEEEEYEVMEQGFNRI